MIFFTVPVSIAVEKLVMRMPFDKLNQPYILNL